MKGEKRARINKTYRLRVDVVRRLERRARERGLSPTAALEDLVETAVAEADPVKSLRVLAEEDRAVRAGSPPKPWRGFTREELHEDDA